MKTNTPPLETMNLPDISGLERIEAEAWTGLQRIVAEHDAARERMAAEIKPFRELWHDAHEAVNKAKAKIELLKEIEAERQQPTTH